VALLTSLHYAGPAVVDCTNGGSGVIHPITFGLKRGNANAGENNLHAYAFDAADDTDATVLLQFRKTGRSKYHTVRSIHAVNGIVDETIKARASGYYRLRYTGSDTTAASTSNVDYVKVLPKK
jgi:hypothetical protein